mmetsp:Transcript_22773/g.51259  ORF Transcript_22773/g.51259 Transcript_22773/m.51259 type:complete len:259 (-) Transcript_22773:223-999(-)
MTLERAPNHFVLTISSVAELSATDLVRPVSVDSVRSSWIRTFCSRIATRGSTRARTSCDNSTCMASSWDTQVESIERRRFTSEPRLASNEPTRASEASARAEVSALISFASALMCRSAASTRPSGTSSPLVRTTGTRPRLRTSSRTARASRCMSSRCCPMARSSSARFPVRSAFTRSSDRWIPAAAVLATSSVSEPKLEMAWSYSSRMATRSLATLWVSLLEDSREALISLSSTEVVPLSNLPSSTFRRTSRPSMSPV